MVSTLAELRAEKATKQSKRERKADRKRAAGYEAEARGLQEYAQTAEYAAIEAAESTTDADIADEVGQ